MRKDALSSANSLDMQSIHKINSHNIINTNSTHIIAYTTIATNPSFTPPPNPATTGAHHAVSDDDFLLKK